MDSVIASSVLICRDCGYDLRGAATVCPECGLDVETSRTFPSYYVAGERWTRRVSRRLSICIGLLAVVVLGIGLSIGFPIGPATWARHWLAMAIVTQIPSLTFAAIPAVLAIAPPPPLPTDWQGLRRTGWIASVASFLSIVVQTFVLDVFPISNTTLQWIAMAVVSLPQLALFAVVPLMLVPLARLLPSRLLMRALFLFAALGAFGLIANTLLVTMYAALGFSRFAAYAFPFQLVMGLSVLISLVGSVTVMIVLRVRTARVRARLTEPMAG